MFMENEMRNLLGYIGCILLLAGMFFTLLKFNSSDYLTALVSETEPTQFPSSSESQKLSNIRIVKNSDGTTDLFIYSSITFTFTINKSGQFFDSSKYGEFVKYSLAQEQTYNLLDLLNDVQERYSKWIILFVALFSLHLINRKCWINLSSF